MRVWCVCVGGVWKCIFVCMHNSISVLVCERIRNIIVYLLIFNFLPLIYKYCRDNHMIRDKSILRQMINIHYEPDDNLVATQTSLTWVHEQYFIGWLYGFLFCQLYPKMFLWTEFVWITIPLFVEESWKKIIYYTSLY